jgi:hypothetical protein
MKTLAVLARLLFFAAIGHSETLLLLKPKHMKERTRPFAEPWRVNRRMSSKLRAVRA